MKISLKIFGAWLILLATNLALIPISEKIVGGLLAVGLIAFSINLGLSNLLLLVPAGLALLSLAIPVSWPPTWSLISKEVVALSLLGIMLIALNAFVLKLHYRRPGAGLK